VQRALAGLRSPAGGDSDTPHSRPKVQYASIEVDSMRNPSMTKKLPAAEAASASSTEAPASERIRARILASGQRFNANDNIAAFIEPGELDQLLAEVQQQMAGVLRTLVIDTDSDHNTQDTARRVAKMYLNEVFRGRYVAAPAVTEFPNVEQLNELMIVGPITVRSACSHHFCPILGKVWIGVMPNEHSNLIGLSKYARLTEWVMSRPQIQEEAVTQLSSLLYDMMQPDGLALVMEADHFCMHWRGVKDMDSKMINSVMRGSFLKDANLRREFLSLLNRNKS
jgi:GTP cyclohydrolase IA